MKRKTEKEKEKYIWRRKILVCGGEEKRRWKRREIFGEGKYFIVEENKNGEGKGGK